jgi:autotransporter-associated beta strand protein
MESGSLALSGNSEIIIGSGEATNGFGSFMQSGGSVSASLLVMGGPWGGSGTYYLSNGQLNLSGVSYQGIALGLQIGQAALCTFNQSGGTLNAAGIIVGGGWQTSGTYNLSSGQVVAGTEAIGMDQGWGQGSSGTFTQSGGSNLANSLILGYYGGDSGTFNLNGGLLILAAGPSLGGGSGAFNFGGGTIASTAPWSSSLNMNMSGVGGPGIVDTTGGNIQLSGLLSGTGGLVKVGTGTLILTGADSYSGMTTVKAGILEIDNAMLLSNLLVSGADIQGGALVLDWTGTDPISTVQADISSGLFKDSLATNGMTLLCTDLNNQITITPSVVPEPSTFALLGIAAIGLCGYAWRRQRRRRA